MAEYYIQDLLNEYTNQREQRVPSDQAIQNIKSLAPDLNDDDRHQLALWIREWELSRPTLEAPHRPADPAETVHVRPESFNITDVMTVQCQHCGTGNPEGSKFCYKCGQLVSRPPAKTAPLKEAVVDEINFGLNATLVLTIRGFEQQPIRTKVTNKPLTLGRSDQAVKANPDVDLNKFKGKELGVSRLHAIIQREDQTLVLLHKSATNPTYINGETVHAHEKRVVRSGDEIRLGRLAIRATFQQS